jgi:uncharacterized protein
MSGRVLIDTGPLVALLVRRDQYHQWAIQHRQNLEPPFLTCEAVVTEAAYLIARSGQNHARVLELLRRDILRIGLRLDDELEPVISLMQRYRDVPMSLADACLVRMAELYPGSRIMTIDSHFRRYRKHRRQAIPLVIPEDRR